MKNYHTPVLLNEAIDALNVQPGKRYIDATVGGGGYTREIARRGGSVLGLDVDQEAIAYTQRALPRDVIDQVTLAVSNFSDIELVARDHGFVPCAGAVFDLGVSSYQLDTPERGFSYRYPDSPLDLRMSKGIKVTARDLVAKLSEEELNEIFTTFGEEKRARAIAHDIVSTRKVTPIITTGQLVAIVLGGKDTRSDEGVLGRVFQALRIAVNDELDALKSGLEGVTRILSPGGRLAVVSFHSLEDRIVKLWMRSALRIITKKPIVPSMKEIRINRRSRSAKLRVCEKI